MCDEYGGCFVWRFDVVVYCVFIGWWDVGSDVLEDVSLFLDVVEFEY